jgi:hypothetical protein
MITSIIFIAAIVASVSLYWLRCRKPFLYGIGELFLGLIVIYVVLFPTETNYLLLAKGEPGWRETWLPKSAGVLAGIYVLVRGLDNMSRELPSSWVPWWKRLFKSPQ